MWDLRSAVLRLLLWLGFKYIMADVRSVEFAVKAVFHQQIYSCKLLFPFWTIKGRTLCFPTKESAVRVVLSV